MGKSCAPMPALCPGKETGLAIPRDCASLWPRGGGQGRSAQAPSSCRGHLWLPERPLHSPGTYSACSVRQALATRRLWTVNPTGTAAKALSRWAAARRFPICCPVCSLLPPTPKSSPAPCAWTGQIPLTRAWGHPNFSSLSHFSRKRRVIEIALPSGKRNELRSPLGSSDTWTGLRGSTNKLPLPSPSSSQQLLPPVSCWSMI